MDQAPNITAQDLLTRQYLRLTRAHTAREVLGILGSSTSPTEAARTNMMVVLDEEGDFAGLLDPPAIFRGLLAGWTPPVAAEGSEPAAVLESSFWEVFQERLDRPVADMLWEDVPRLGPDDRLPRMLAAFGARPETTALPVMEDGQVAGLVYLGDLFAAVAALALGPQDRESPIRL